MIQNIYGGERKMIILAAVVACELVAAGNVARGVPLQPAVVPAPPASARSEQPLTTRPSTRWQYPLRASSSPVRPASEPMLFGSVADYLKSGRVPNPLQFPGGNGSKDFEVDGWTYYVHIKPRTGQASAANGGYGTGGPVGRTSFSLAFLACRSGNRFVMLAKISSRAMIYFCSVGNKRMTVLLPLLGDGPILWTDEGGTSMRISVVKTQAGGRSQISLGYSGKLPKVQFQVNEGAVFARSLRRSAVISYDGWRNFFSATEGGPHHGDWIAARFRMPTKGVRNMPPEITALQFGIVAVLPKGRGIAGNDNIIMRQRPVRQNMAYFRTSPKGIGAIIGGRLSKISGRKMSLAVNRFLVFVNSHPRRATRRDVKSADRFLRWAGGSAVKIWYRCSNAKYIRTTTLSSIAPFAKAWDAAKGRFRKGFTFVPPGLR